MTKYRKKPVVIDAIQFNGFNFNELKEFCGEYLIAEQREGLGVVGHFIKTLEGNSYLISKNDYIIKGVKGEFYPCKPDVFESTYELVEDE